MEIEKLRTTVFRPSCNGVVERFHRTLNSMLAKAVSDSQRDWDERLPLVLSAYRATPHESKSDSDSIVNGEMKDSEKLQIVVELSRV